MITYNHENYIEQAIEGVLMQLTDFTFKLVIGEDCSTDGTRKLCEQYQKRYPDIIELLPSDQNLGIVPNFLRTIEACEGRYIAFCEGDDYWIDERKLQKQMEFLESNKDYVICATDFNIVQNGEITKKYGYSLALGEKTLNDVLIQNQFSTPTVCIRTDILKKIQLKSLMTYKIGDWPLWLTIMAYGKGMVLSDVTTVYREHDQGAFSLIPYKSKLKMAVLTVTRFIKDNRIETTEAFGHKLKKDVWLILLQTKNIKERQSILFATLPFLDINKSKKHALMQLAIWPHFIFSRIGWRLL